MSSRIDGIVARLQSLHPVLIDLSLDRLRRLLAALGHPERRLPPILHVAGTNGKGSTCAFLRAIGEAAGLRVHVYTSPHLVRFNERIRLAGELVSDEALERAFLHVEAVNDGAPITVFEVITATAFHLFATTPADLCVLDVGLGGRGDATNVIDAPAASAITAISMDHREMLGDTLAAIAAEKAGIIKPGVPVAIGPQTAEVMDLLAAIATERGAPPHRAGTEWHIARAGAGLRYEDADGALDLPLPALPGAHQWDNAGIAIAALRAAGLAPGAAAIGTGLGNATWPARMQRLNGRLAARLPPGWELWLDGGHNPGAGVVLGGHLAGWSDRPVHLIVGMKQAKDTAEFLRPILPYAASLWAVAEPGQHLALPVAAIREAAAQAGARASRPGPTVAAALAQIAAEAGPQPARVLICGSLYLAGEVLKADAAAG
ncbi:MAG: bifunctional folylpolyglutamate synthase/dihydrofolate synthase [Rhodospirillales bacterium]|nr:bifunctional folylpolyglutamate synthase/dihydrofolate synthase [Rhodospirillales bacterium]